MKTIHYLFNGREKSLCYSEENLLIAAAEAVSGEYQVKESEAAPSALTIEERISALERSSPAPAAYSAGVWYYRGDRVSFEGAAYVCIAPEGVVCVWSPQEYPTYWSAIV